MTTPRPPEPPVLTHGRVWAVAGPIIASNASVPLIGIVDTAVVGNLGEAVYIGAVAVGALIFSSLYWLMGFLRMGTTGLTAQALGAGDRGETEAALGRAAILAIGIGLVLIVGQGLVEALAFHLMAGSDAVEGLARDYFAIRIWGAPAMLVQFALVGWFIGLQRTDLSFILQIVLNLLNVALDVLFVLGLDMGVEGVAWGTVIAEYATLGVGAGLALLPMGGLPMAGDPQRLSRLLDRRALARLIAVNRDIFIRSAFLIAGFWWFVRDGAAAGDVVLAANAVLLHFIHFAAYALDGFAFAAEAFVGAAIGARAPRHLRRAVRLTTLWAVVSAVALALFYAGFGGAIIRTLTNVETVREAAHVYLPWAVALPVLSVWAFQLDGIFIGATQTRVMASMMALAFGAFLLFWWILEPRFGNHGLWAAFSLFALARAAGLAPFYGRVVRKAAEPRAA